MNRIIAVSQSRLFTGDRGRIVSYTAPALTDAQAQPRTRLDYGVTVATRPLTFTFTLEPPLSTAKVAMLVSISWSVES